MLPSLLGMLMSTDYVGQCDVNATYKALYSNSRQARQTSAKQVCFSGRAESSLFYETKALRYGL